MEYREKILGLVKARGPLLPAAVAKELGTNILMASAMLAELSEKGHVKISSLKVGGSPLYFLPGQEEQLQNFFSSLNEKDRRAAELLRDKKLLRDNELEPLTRVSLRGIKDFARPLEVTLGDAKEIFWKWVFLPDSEAEQMIRQHLGQPKPKAEQRAEPRAGQKTEPEQRIERKFEQRAEPEQRKLRQEKERETPKVEKEAREPKEAKPKAATGEFTAAVASFFNANKIKIIEEKCVKKNSDYDFVVEMESPVGSLQYYCKAKSKKTVGDADLAAAFVQGQLRKLPTLLISTGTLSKRAKEMLGREFKGMVVKQI